MFWISQDQSKTCLLRLWNRFCIHTTIAGNCVFSLSVSGYSRPINHNQKDQEQDHETCPYVRLSWPREWRNPDGRTSASWRVKLSNCEKGRKMPDFWFVSRIWREAKRSGGNPSSSDNKNGKQKSPGDQLLLPRPLAQRIYGGNMEAVSHHVVAFYDRRSPFVCRLYGHCLIPFSLHIFFPTRVRHLTGENPAKRAFKTWAKLALF